LAPGVESPRGNKREGKGRRKWTSSERKKLPKRGEANGKNPSIGLTKKKRAHKERLTISKKHAHTKKNKLK